MADSFEIQTEAQVKAIESRKIIQDIMGSQNVPNDTLTTNIEGQISNIAETIDALNIEDISNKIDNIDTGMLQAQVSDMLIKIQKQQDQINSIEKKIDMLLDKT